MRVSLKSFFAWALLPPGNILLLGLLGVLLWRRRSGLVLMLGSLVLLFVLSTPYTAWPLIKAAQWPQPPLTSEQARQSGAGAIVVLGAGTLRDIPDYGDTVNDHSLIRVRHAARVHRWSELPVVPVGGGSRGVPVGILMADILRDEFHIPVPWVEHDSLNTRENAEFSRRLLAPHGVDRIILVTEAMHMARSVRAFEQAGFEVVPAATHYVAPIISLYAFTPQVQTLGRSWLALYEILGGWWYRLKEAL